MGYDDDCAHIENQSRPFTTTDHQAVFWAWAALRTVNTGLIERSCQVGVHIRNNSAIAAYLDQKPDSVYVYYSEPAAPLLCMRTSAGVFLSKGRA